MGTATDDGVFVGVRSGAEVWRNCGSRKAACASSAMTKSPL